MSQGSVKPLPNYQVVPLRSDVIQVAAIQSRNQTIDSKNPKPGLRRNTEHLCWLVDKAQARFGSGGRKDLIVFSEMPIAGWEEDWDRDDCLRISIELPGEETEMLGAKAKQHNCYIAFGSYCKHKDWPGHFISTATIVGPSGDIVAALWKARNWRGLGATEIFATTVFDVLDEYVERYGWDAVWPVARLDIGNIGMGPYLREPEIARAMSVMGAEIIISDWSPGNGQSNEWVSLQADCLTNDVWGMFCAQAVSLSDTHIEDVGYGYSSIIDNFGRPVARAVSHHETVVSAAIPMAAFRARHSIPVVAKELYTDLWRKYSSKYPPNMYAQYLPKDLIDAARQVHEVVQW